MRGLALLALGCLAIGRALAQSSSYLPYDQDLYQILDHAAIRTGNTAWGRLGSVRPYLRSDVVAVADSLEPLAQSSSRYKALQQFLREDSPELAADSLLAHPKPLAKVLYRNRASLYSVRLPEFDLHVNPVFTGQFGRDQEGGLTTYINTRGVEVRGTIDKRVSFYTFLADNQAVFPNYVQQIANSPNALYPGLPYEAYVKPLNQQNLASGGYDFITARGHIAFKATKHINLAFGQDRHFIGDGYRSLILSDFAPAMPFLKVETSVWRIKYTNLFMQGKAGGRRPSDAFIPNKFYALHQLDIALLKNLHVSFYESVVFSPGDTTKRGLFDLSYLNPIIFYRFVEQYNGSDDNALVGMSARWDVKRRLRLYGQLVLDELKISELTAQKGWWGNKYALQGGFILADPGIEGLQVQGELNVVRPFTYAHEDKFRAYTNYNLPMAHPNGANFTELVGRVSYFATAKIRLDALATYLKTGRGTAGFNAGDDPLRSYQQGRQEYGNTIAQGTPVTITNLQLRASYQPYHRVIIEAGLNLRKQTSDDATLKMDTRMFYGALRWNMAGRALVF